MIKALLVRPGEDGEVIDVDLSSPRSVQELVGGYFTAVTGEGWHAYLPEEPQGHEGNVFATMLLQTLGRPSGWIVGPVLVLGPDDEHDVPAEVLQICTVVKDQLTYYANTVLND